MRKPLTPTRTALFAVTATTLVCGALFALVELGGRAYIHFRYGVPGKTYGLWRYDEAIGAQHRENAYNTNAQTNNYGFRGTEDVFDPKPKHALRIITYGGSTTYCYNLSNEETWPARLERQLRLTREGSHDQVLNGGAIMWSLGHALARAKKDLPTLKPDFVVIYSGINEETNAAFLGRQERDLRNLVSRGEFGHFATNLDQNSWYARNLLTWRIANYVLRPLIVGFGRYDKASLPTAAGATGTSPQALGATADAVLDEFVVRNYLETLDRFFDLIASHGARGVFVIQAHGKVSAARYTAFSRRGAVRARRKGAIVVDGNEIVKTYSGDPMDLFIESGVHLTAEGARRLALLIWNTAFATRQHRGVRSVDERLGNRKTDV